MGDKKIQVNLSTSQKYLEAGSPQTIYVMLQIVQPKIDLGTDRLPVNVGFVIDRSGSMRGEKLDYTRQAVQFALNHLDKDDTVSVVVFDDQVDVLVPATKVENKDHLILSLIHIFPQSLGPRRHSPGRSYPYRRTHGAQSRGCLLYTSRCV